MSILLYRMKGQHEEKFNENLIYKFPEMCFGEGKTVRGRKNRLIGTND